MNFCAGCLDPSVKTNKPEADGREVTNLISQNPDVKKNGYMGEYFIRPPVDITFEFTVPIDVSHIKLNVKLDQKLSTGFFIFAQPEETTIQSKGQPKKSETISDVVSSSSSTSATNVKSPDTLLTEYYSCAPPKMYSSMPTPSTSVQSDLTILGDVNSNDVYFCVGKFFTKNEEHLILKNPYYRHWLNIKMPADNVGIDSLKVYRGSLKHSNRLALRCVKRMIIRIIKTTGSIPPVLQAIEIWGQPGISTNKSLRKTCVRKWHGRPQIEDPVPLVPRIYSSEPEAKKQITYDEVISKSIDSFEIPEDFLDPLTCDVMTVPLLLPSGHSIDAHTLERFIASESIWGRHASDPFTGVTFKSGQMPSPNVPLKARIDRFISMNADHPLVQTCGRTLSATSGIQIAAGLSTANFVQTDNRRHVYDFGSKRKLENTDASSKEKHISFEKKCHSKDDSCKLVENKMVEILSEGTSDAMKDVDESYFDMNGSIKKSQNCKSGNNKSSNCADNDITSNITGVMQNKAGTLPKGSVPQQSKKQVLNPIKKPPRHIAVSRPPSSHHGLIHMISSALSRTQQRNDGVKTRDQRALGKPSTIIQGDAKPKDTSVLELVSKNAAACQCGDKSELYKVPCKHVICRQCLLRQQNNSSEVQCETCGHLCRRSDVIKYHEKSIFSVG